MASVFSAPASLDARLSDARDDAVKEANSEHAISFSLDYNDENASGEECYEEKPSHNELFDAVSELFLKLDSIGGLLFFL